MHQNRLVFISYAHEDSEWLRQIVETFRKRSNANHTAQDVIWVDQDSLKPGKVWDEEIRNAMRRASVGLLIVSEHFHHSEFIRHVELPELLKRTEDEQIRLTWIRIDDVDYKMSNYSKYQSIILPEPPLGKMNPQEQQRHLEHVANQLEEMLFGGTPKPAPNVFSSLNKASLACCACFALVITLLSLSTRFGDWRPDKQNVFRMIYSNNWITYEPRGFAPRSREAFTSTEILTELDLLKQQGFSGIVTFGGREDLAQIPKLAHERGFAVIMGIWNPLDSDEIKNAYAQKEYVEAYCVGHNCLTDDLGGSVCTEAELERVIKWLRRHTHKPVTTTQLAKRYQTDSFRLITMSDFLCPDLHHNYLGDVIKDAEITVSEIKRLAHIADRFAQPLLSKTMTYPVCFSIDREFDYERQSGYFEAVIRQVRDPLSGSPVPVAFVLHSTFDSPWKIGGSFNQWDPFTGLFESNGQPRPVVNTWQQMR